MSASGRSAQEPDRPGEGEAAIEPCAVPLSGLFDQLRPPFDIADCRCDHRFVEFLDSYLPAKKGTVRGQRGSILPEVQDKASAAAGRMLAEATRLSEMMSVTQ